MDAVVHFPLILAEVTMGASPSGKVTFRSYLEEETGELLPMTPFSSCPLNSEASLSFLNKTDVPRPLCSGFFAVP